MLPNEFLQTEEISVDSIIKNFSTTLDAPAYSLPRHNSSVQLPSSCQPGSSPPPSSGSVVVAWSHLASRSTTAPTPFCAVTPAPSPSESGHRTRSLPSAASSPIRQRTPSLAARVAMADCWVRTQKALPQPSGSRFQTLWFHHLLLQRCHETVPELFTYPARRFLHAQDWRRLHSLHRRGPIPSMGTTREVRPLTSSPSSRGQSSVGALWKTAYTPVDGQTSRVYPVNPVQYLYISCYVTANKLVL